jgi:hypothetical protein
MMKKGYPTSTEGEGTELPQIDSEWLGWTGRVAHPDSPLGGGGPGFFSRLPIMGRSAFEVPSARPLGSHDDIPVGAEPTSPAREPPIVSSERPLGKLLSVQSEFVDIELDAMLLADSGGGTKTTETLPRFPVPAAPGYGRDKEGKITSFTGKLIWRGTITIQTLYAAGAKPKDGSCYGRGTTDADVASRDITLGFHESRHRQDYIDYLRTHPLPKPPSLVLGMKASDYEVTRKAFIDAVSAYQRDMKQVSVQNTDEVGHRLSARKASGKCFKHAPTVRR